MSDRGTRDPTPITIRRMDGVLGAQVNGVDLAYEEYGDGFPLIWVHEFAGSMESWLPQVNFFSRRYRVIVYNARGYPPSAVPADASKYGQD